MRETKATEPVARGRVCSNCTAFVGSLSARFCEFCGAELPPPPAGARPHTPHDQRREVFFRLREHPKLETLLSYRPSVIGAGERGAVALVANAVFLALAGIAAVALASGLGRARVPAPVLGILFLVLCVFAFLGLKGIALAAKRAAENARAETEARLCVIVDERVHVSGGGGNTSARTSYFATLEDEQGNRQEYPITLELSSVLAPNDAGIAYFRRGALLDFRRLSA